MNTFCQAAGAKGKEYSPAIACSTSCSQTGWSWVRDFLESWYLLTTVKLLLAWPCAKGQLPFFLAWRRQSAWGIDPSNSSSGLPFDLFAPCGPTNPPTTVLPTPCGQSSPPIVLRWRGSTRIKGVTLSLLRASWLAMRPLSHVREGAPSKPRGQGPGVKGGGAPGLHACKPASMWPDSIRLIVMHRCRCCTGSVSKDRWDQLAILVW